MSRLGSHSLENVRGNPDVDVFTYDRETQKIGIVHFGIGAFHRAHQAWYTDLAMSRGERDWMIAGVSLRSAAVMHQLNPQGGLYSVTERGGSDNRTRLVGSVRQILVGSQDRRKIVGAISSSHCRIVSFTVTEKGYCRRVDGSLDFDLASQGFYPLLAEALGERRAAGLSGLTLLSCDNLAHNGEQLGALLSEYLEAYELDLARWFGIECTSPSTMVDRIVPATTEDDLERVRQTLENIEDQGAVVTEPFSQWVIEDCFAGARPGWDNVGVQFVEHVAPFEEAKIRMLNGAHSALAYLGLERGHIFVHEAIADPAIRETVEDLMMLEAAPTITAAPGQDLAAYARALVRRFSNCALEHRLVQIAMDGSQKIPQRWLATLAENQRVGRNCPAILTALGAWLRHVRGDNGLVNDPLSDQFQAIWHHARESDIVAAIFGVGGVIKTDWRPIPYSQFPRSAG